jgi:hypothetical protein
MSTVSSFLSSGAQSVISVSQEAQSADIPATPADYVGSVPVSLPLSLLNTPLLDISLDLSLLDD